jgi:hypothetical protein
MCPWLIAQLWYGLRCNSGVKGYAVLIASTGALNSASRLHVAAHCYGV